RYNNVCIKKGDKWKTAFCTRYSAFEYLVMLFGLTNALAMFQHFMNDVFVDMVDFLMVVYLDDILIYSITTAEHVEHVCRILQQLCDYQLHVNLTKSSFHLDSVEYLGLLSHPVGFL